MSEQTISIWADPDVRRIYDLVDGRPWPRFSDFNDQPDRLQLVLEFVQADQAAGSAGPADGYLQACRAGVRAVETLDGRVDPGWIKFLVFQVDQNNAFLWDLYRRSAEVAAVAEWTVETIERHGWGPDGRTSAIGQVHAGAMALAAEAGGGVRRNPQTGAFERGDGSEARRLAGITDQPSTADTDVAAGGGEEPPAGGESMSPDQLLAKRLEEAEQGDRTSLFVLHGVAAKERGDEAAALGHFEQAARLGDVESMVEVAIIYMSRNDHRSARFWFESSADAGYTKSFGYLVKLAEQAGDQEAEREWSRKGAEAGDAWAMGNHAYFLLTDAIQAQQRGTPEPQVMALINECYGYAVRAANMGQVNAMYSAGLSSAILGNSREAYDWLVHAEQNGHPNARKMIEQWGLA